jgi:hypothetical protein
MRAVLFIVAPLYHTNVDTPDKINYDDLALVTTGLSKVVRDLASD